MVFIIEIFYLIRIKEKTHQLAFKMRLFKLPKVILKFEPKMGRYHENIRQVCAQSFMYEFRFYA